MRDRPNRARAAAMIRAMAPAGPTLRIRIAGEIDEAMASRIVAAVRAAPFARRIETTLDSRGGSLMHATAIAKAIEAHGAAVKACRIRRAHSAAMLVGIAHNVRRAPAAAQAHFHGCEMSEAPKLGRMTAVSFARIGKRLHDADRAFVEHVAARTDLSPEDVDRLMLCERTLDAFGMLRAGIVQEIEGVTRAPSAALATGWQAPGAASTPPASFSRIAVRMSSPRAIMGAPRHLAGRSFRIACEALATEAEGGAA